MGCSTPQLHKKIGKKKKKKKKAPLSHKSFHTFKKPIRTTPINDA
jgi:hypothetical protein